MFILKKEFPVRPRLYLSLFKRLIRHFDIIMCDFLAEHAIIFQRLGKLIPRKKRVIGRVHRYEIFTPFPAKLDPSFFHEIIAVSQWTKSHFLQQNPAFPVENVHLIYNGIDPARFCFNQTSNPRKTQFVSVSGIRPVKGFYDLVQNWPQNVPLSIVGPVDALDYYRYIQELIKLRKREETIQLLNPIPNQDLPAFLKQSKFYINHSVNESFSVATMEAIASGLIPLIRDWPAAWEIYPAEYIYCDIPEMLTKIKMLLALDVSKILKRQKKLRSLVESRFTVDIQMRQINQLLERN